MFYEFLFLDLLISTNLYKLALNASELIYKEYLTTA